MNDKELNVLRLKMLAVNYAVLVPVALFIQDYFMNFYKVDQMSAILFWGAITGVWAGVATLGDIYTTHLGIKRKGSSIVDTSLAFHSPTPTLAELHSRNVRLYDVGILVAGMLWPPIGFMNAIVRTTAAINNARNIMLK